MNQEETRRAAQVMQAFADGKTIQYRPRNRDGALAFDWTDCKAAVGVSLTWDFNWGEYRIKPEAIPPVNVVYVVEVSGTPTADPYARHTFTTLQKAHEMLALLTPKEDCGRVIKYVRATL